MGWLSNLFGSKSRRYVTLEGDGLYDCEVIGESHYQLALSSITGGKTADGHEFECTALLELDPRNQFDPNAIIVTIDDLLVGHISRPHAKALKAVFRKHRLDGGYAKALIVGGWIHRRGRKPEGHFGVRLDIPVSYGERSKVRQGTRSGTGVRLHVVNHHALRCETAAHLAGVMVTNEDGLP